MPPLAAIDRQLLSVLCTHRVVTQAQLARLFPDVPERTLRYRTRRLHDLGLAGRSRPYRESGSAPNHHWPTRRADCLMHGDPAPRGGERREPNPLFLAHAAALTGLYVALATRGDTDAGLRLTGYLREGDAREPFTHDGKNRALAPDALIVLTDEQGRELRAFVEIDLGTMGHARLRQKAKLYTAYARSRAWQERHPFLPVLLFLTTTPPRAARFLTALDQALREPARRFDSRRRTALVAGAGALAQDPDRLLDEACLTDLYGHDGIRLLDALYNARAPYERALADRRERQEAQARQRERLCEDPEAMREHLRRYEGTMRPYAEAAGGVGALAFALLTSSTAALTPAETAALREIAHDLGDALLEPYQYTQPEPGACVTEALGRLAEHYRASQQTTVEELTQRHGEMPSLRRAAQMLQHGGLLSDAAVRHLPRSAERDRDTRREQHGRGQQYLAWRERTAQRLLKEAGPLGRLTHRKEEFYPQLDTAHVRVCARCNELLYPTPDPDHPAGDPQAIHHCAYCASNEHLLPYRPRTESEA